jgi:hypothetical protein
MTPQAAGAFGEKAVEAELLRRNWMPANVNATVKNAADVDIYAFKRNRSVKIRVKTCRPNMSAVLFGSFHPDQLIPIHGIEATDFTVIVRMHDQRGKDEFYVVPTIVVRKLIRARQAYFRRRGAKDIGMFRLRFPDRKDGAKEPGAGIGRKWKPYLDAWKLLDG